MTDLREKLADICDAEIQSDNPSCYVLSDAIIDALPGLVKPLEWSGAGTWGNQPAYYADGAFGWVQIVDHRKHGNGFRVYPPWEEGEPERHPGLEAAKAAAQADYTRRILAAFGIAEESE